MSTFGDRLISETIPARQIGAMLLGPEGVVPDTAPLLAGADIAIAGLHALRFLPAKTPAERPGGRALSNALESLPEIAARARGRGLAVFLDYDGTLTPIVARPELARLARPMRQALEALAAVATVAVVSGRDRVDVARRVDLPQLYYAGSHGFDIGGPGGLRMRHEGGAAARPMLRQTEEELRGALATVRGVLIEPKDFALAVHYRLVDVADLPQVEQAVSEVASRHPALRRTGGKKVFELRPAMDWNKGSAVQWMLEALDLDNSSTLPIYLGDDETDEDAFRALSGKGIGILVGEPTWDTRADYLLPDTEAVERFLRYLAQHTPSKGDERMRP